MIFARRAVGPAHARRRRAVPARRQHGSIAVTAAIFLGLAVVALGSLDIGNVYYARRQLQRTADMAALAGVQVISTPSGCTAVTNAAQLNATSNGFTADGKTTTLTTTCGRWDTTSKTYFGTTGNPLNAVQVKAAQKVPYLFLGPARNVSATATALSTNIDAFSLGTSLATINTQQSALLNAILGGLLKSTVSLSVGDVQSLATAHIKLGDLMTALSASTMQGLLQTTVSYQNLMLAMVAALQAGGDTINAAILQKVAVSIPGGQNITIGDGGTSAPGLLALGLANANSAATATINAFDALMVAAQIAQSNASGTAPVINVAAGIAGVAGLTLQVIHPPVLAVGEAGTNADGTPRTKARTAVVNATVQLTPVLFANPLVIGVPGVLAVSVSALSTPLVLSLNAGSGKAVLTSVDCESSKAATNAVITAKPAIANVCLSGSTSCSGSVNVASVTASVPLLTVTVANVALNSTGWLSLGPSASTPLTFNGSTGSFDSTQSVNSNAIGSDASALTTGVLNVLPTMLQIGLLNNAINISSLLQPILTGVANALTPLLTPVFGLLDTVLVPTLSLLGAQVGIATVHNMSLQCGVAQLVN